jgi:hypothetical protein
MRKPARRRRPGARRRAMSLHDPLRHEIAELASRATDDSLDAGGRQRLEEILKSSSEARAFYVRFMGISTALAWVVRGGVSLAPLEEPAPRSFFTRTRVWAAAAVLVLAALGAWLAFHKTAPVAPRQEPAFATLSAVTENIEWETGQEPRHMGNALLPGWIRIKSGVAQIDLISGISLWLEGPAGFQLLSPSRGSLEAGKLVVQVPHGTIGFQVDCPLGTIVDHGTAFGVEMKTGEVDVHVFSGLVEVTPNNGATGLYAAGQAVAVDDSGTVYPMFFDPRSFDNAGYGWGFNSFGILGAGRGPQLWPGSPWNPIWGPPPWKGWDPLGFVRVQLNISNERWEPIQPVLSAYWTAQWQLDSLGYSGPDNPFSRAAWELWWGTQNPDVTDEELQSRLASYREARQDICRQRDQAEEDLKAMLAPSEEATLMDMGYLR